VKLNLIDPLAPELRRSYLSFLPSFDGEGDGGGDDGDGDEGDENDDDGDDDDDGEGDDDDKDKDKPLTRAEANKILRSARKARSDAARLRRENAELKAGKDDKNKDDGPDYRAAAVTTTAYSALKDAGFTGDMRKASKILRDLDLSDIEPDKRGFFNPDDFIDVIEDVQDEWPELFEKKSKAKSTGCGRKLPADQEFARQVMGSAGYDNAARRIASGR
jgi:hypothetical protein